MLGDVRNYILTLKSVFRDFFQILLDLKKITLLSIVIVSRLIFITDLDCLYPLFMYTHLNVHFLKVTHLYTHDSKRFEDF